MTPDLSGPLARAIADLHRRQASIVDAWLSRLGVAPAVPTSGCALEDDASSVFESFLDGLRSGRADRLRVRAWTLASHLGQRPVTLDGLLGLLLPLRDVIARHVSGARSADQAVRCARLDCFEAAANRVIASLARAWQRERERVQSAERAERTAAWAPVLPLRDRLLVLPVVGLMDRGRPTRLTEQVLVSIQTYRARVVVLDLTSVPFINRDAAFELSHTIEAAQLLGARLILTGLSRAAVDVLRAGGLDPASLRTAADLETGVRDAEQLLGRGQPDDDSDPLPAA